jgi:hypothetical protein
MRLQRPMGSQAHRSVPALDGVMPGIIPQWIHPAQPRDVVPPPLGFSGNGNNVTACENSSAICLLSIFPDPAQLKSYAKSRSKTLAAASARLIFDHRPTPKAGLACFSSKPHYDWVDCVPTTSFPVFYWRLGPSMIRAFQLASYQHEYLSRPSLRILCMLFFPIIKISHSQSRPCRSFPFPHTTSHNTSLERLNQLT